MTPAPPEISRGNFSQRRKRRFVKRLDMAISQPADLKKEKVAAGSDNTSAMAASSVLPT
jgi:hypothetical protein